MTADVNRWQPLERFDRIVSVEMLEHVRNYERLFGRIASWLEPGGQVLRPRLQPPHLRLPVRPHLDGAEVLHRREHALGRPAAPVPARPRLLGGHWRVSGPHYSRTAEAWLERLDANEEAVTAVLAEAHGSQARAPRSTNWRVFFLACAELWGFRQGTRVARLALPVRAARLDPIDHTHLVTYVPAADRYERMTYNRSGRSGLLLPAVSLGLWNNFGHDHPLETSRAIVRRAFDLGITHFDLANNYGPPYGSAEENFGRLLATDLAPYRDELVVSTKAGYDMWPGPYGEWGSRKYLLASLDQSLARMGLDYVDLFYSHRFDPETPLEETMGALDTAVRQGKALYVGISSYSAEKTREAAGILRELGTPFVIHQPSYSLLNRWIEPELLDTLGELGLGCIVFSPLAQGMLTDKYLDGIPDGSRASRESSLSPTSSRRRRSRRSAR